MEYLTFGRSLERCRFCFLPLLTGSRNALLLGDGDGRFAARLLRAAPEAHVTAVDCSTAMLQALCRRCAQPDRVTALCVNVATAFIEVPEGETFDVVASHFFLDCLTTTQVETLAGQVKLLLSPGARWIISEFRVPSGIMRLPSLALVRLLYAAFRLLAKLRIQHLPDHRHVLQQSGFACTQRRHFLCGLLTAEEWQLAAGSKEHTLK